MLLIWRFQQVNSMIIIVGLSMTLTLQIYPYISWRFYFLIDPELDWLIILVIFIIIFSGAVIIGIKETVSEPPSLFIWSYPVLDDQQIS